MLLTKVLLLHSAMAQFRTMECSTSSRAWMTSVSSTWWTCGTERDRQSTLSKSLLPYLDNTLPLRFYDEDCGKVNGSFGEGWPPRRERTDISLYSTDLCRWTWTPSLKFVALNDAKKQVTYPVLHERRFEKGRHVLPLRRHEAHFRQRWRESR